MIRIDHEFCLGGAEMIKSVTQCWLAVSSMGKLNACEISQDGGTSADWGRYATGWVLISLSDVMNERCPWDIHGRGTTRDVYGEI